MGPELTEYFFLEKLLDALRQRKDYLSREMLAGSLMKYCVEQVLSDATSSSPTWLTADHLRTYLKEQNTKTRQ